MPRTTHSRSDLKSLTRRQRNRVSTRTAARCLDVHPSTVRRMCQRGELDARRIGRSWKIDRDSLIDALKYGTEDLS